MHWNEARLREMIDERLGGYRVIVVSNRAPYAECEAGGERYWIRPASGMAMALEPVMRACAGIWVAQDTGPPGPFERGASPYLGVPPENPRYRLRRVHLPDGIDSGFYDGLSNGALWPLCHVAFRQPRFDPEAWRCYKIANEIFAGVVAEEAGDHPALVLVQDYHFGLLPLMLKQLKPHLLVGQFWHIPWPNAEVFGIFPWQQELLSGLLACDLIGFHLRRHCSNFLDAVEQAMEAKVDRVGLEILRAEHCTRVRPFPISIDFEQHSAQAAGEDAAQEMWRWWERLGFPRGPIGIGIDRVDYTKGIPQRLRALDSLLEHYPEYRGRLVFAQVGVPSREGVPDYVHLAREIEELVSGVNLRWAEGAWRPVHYFHEGFPQTSLMGLHHVAAFCIVNSLHDGMNLVAKEFVSSRNDERGVLLLSRFAGAAAELGDALVFNPHDVEATREAMRAALTMPEEEQARRMKRMRETLAEANVYRWAGKFLQSLSRLDNSMEVQSTACQYAH
jgi:trehalose-6-phosphate synthase